MDTHGALVGELSVPDRIPRGTDAEVWWRRFSGARAIFWTAVIPIAVLLDWVSSVAFVAACSLYANVASDIAAWRSDVNPQLDRIEERLGEIEKLLKDAA